jgi:hypothetical protein
MLDSLNDTANSAKNDQYRGAFAVFACFSSILHSKRWQNADGSNFTEIRIPAARARRLRAHQGSACPWLKPERTLWRSMR